MSSNNISIVEWVFNDEEDEHPVAVLIKMEDDNVQWLSIQQYQELIS
jgi:hypothetical protein